MYLYCRELRIESYRSIYRSQWRFLPQLQPLAMDPRSAPWAVPGPQAFRDQLFQPSVPDTD